MRDNENTTCRSWLRKFRGIVIDLNAYVRRQ